MKAFTFTCILLLAFSFTFAQRQFVSDFIKSSQDFTDLTPVVLNGFDTPELLGTGVSNIMVKIPPCFAQHPHYHPGATESDFIVTGKIFYEILITEGTEKKVVNGTLLPRQILNIPKGTPHILSNPFAEPLVFLEALNSDKPGNFQLDGFTQFDKFASITGLGQDERTYDQFEKDTDLSFKNFVTRAKGEAFRNCLRRNKLPMPTPNQEYTASPSVFSAETNAPPPVTNRDEDVM